MKLLGRVAINENQNILKLMNYATFGFREILLYKKINGFLENVSNTLEILKKTLIKYDIINLLPRLSFELILISLFAILFFSDGKIASNLILNSSVYLYAFVKISPSLIKIVNLTNAINYGEYATKVIKHELKKNNFKNKKKSKVQKEYKFLALNIKNLSIKLNNNVKIRYPNLTINKFDKV